MDRVRLLKLPEEMEVVKKKFKEETLLQLLVDRTKDRSRRE